MAFGVELDTVLLVLIANGSSNIHLNLSTNPTLNYGLSAQKLTLMFILIENDTQVVRSPSILPSPAVSRKKQEGDATMVRICSLVYFCIFILLLFLYL